MKHLKQSEFICDDLTEEDRLAIARDEAADIASGKLNDLDICENCGRDYSRVIGHSGWCPTCAGGF